MIFISDEAIYISYPPQKELAGIEEMFEF